MEISRAAIGAVAALCVAAGAGGAYLATRGGEPAAMAAGAEAGLVSPDPAVATVEQSEAIVAEMPLEAAPPRAMSAPDVRRTPAARPAAQPVRQAAPPAPVVRYEPVAPAIEPVRTLEVEPLRAPEPPAPLFDDLVVAPDSVIGLQVETALSTEEAEVEDEVIARVTRDVRVGDRVAIPAGSRAHGEVTLVEPGGRLRERARLGIRFTSVVFADGTRVPLETETIYREGDAPGGESAAKIGGGAIGGAIIGGILGGAKGAVIGGSAGDSAGAGTAAVLAGGRNPAMLAAGTPITVRVIEPATVTVER